MSGCGRLWHGQDDTDRNRCFSFLELGLQSFHSSWHWKRLTWGLVKVCRTIVKASSRGAIEMSWTVGNRVPILVNGWADLANWLSHCWGRSAIRNHDFVSRWKSGYHRTSIMRTAVTNWTFKTLCRLPLLIPSSLSDQVVAWWGGLPVAPTMASNICCVLEQFFYHLTLLEAEHRNHSAGRTDNELELTMHAPTNRDLNELAEQP